MSSSSVSRQNHLVALLAFTTVLFASCTRSVTGDASIVMNWQAVDSLNTKLPDGIRVYSGSNEHLPLKAWYVRIQESRPEIFTKVLLSDDSRDNRETVSSFAHDENAVVAINAGYFVMGQTPARHAGLLVCDGKIMASATRSVMRKAVRYPAARSAIGFTEDDRIDIKWVRNRHDTLFAWSEPLKNRQNKPKKLDFKRAILWQVNDAVSAGPMLISKGKVHVATDEEVFFGSAIPNVHPRSAAGITANGELILMAVDGRQPESRGVNLEELADLMLGVGSVWALNLDGGGSTTLIVNGLRLNRPSGGDTEREVMSVLATFVRK